MIIQIDGAATVNKGGELMLYSMLEQIEKHNPDAEVFWNAKAIAKPAKYINTPLHFYRRKFLEKYGKWIATTRIEGIFRKLKLPYLWFTPFYVSKRLKVDVILDGRGYTFNDKMSLTAIKEFEKYYEKHKKNGTMIILMPQAFGPFNTKNSNELVSILNRNISLAIAREDVSKDNLINAGFDPEKVWVYTDFTGLCKGYVPNSYKFLDGLICVIPNIRIIKDAGVTEKEYIDYISRIISYCELKNKSVFLLNHESKKDFELCKKINQKHNNRLPIVDGLNAKEIKGIISQSFMVISARYHGVASALNSGVPCLANSWSHKYELLFKDFGQHDMILDIKSPFENTKEKIDEVFDPINYSKIKKELENLANDNRKNNLDMWERIWNFVEMAK
jgi:polysaccharide pyruvyl transferase WcaK-like protein